MTYERACVLVDGAWLRLWVPKGFHGAWADGAWAADACARCLPDGWKDSDGHEVEVRTSYVGAAEWFGEEMEG